MQKETNITPHVTGETLGELSTLYNLGELDLSDVADDIADELVKRGEKDQGNNTPIDKYLAGIEL